MTTISIRTGSEGPRHDPYHYDEITLTRTDGLEVTAHLGLAEWIRVGDGPRSHDAGCKDVQRFFRILTGITPGQAMEYKLKYEERKIKYHPCGVKNLSWESGFPGEELLWCNKCGKVLDSHFDRSAIE